MKKIILFLFTSMLLVACGIDNRSKAIDLVEKQISDQVVGEFQYSILDSLFTSVHANETYIANLKNLLNAENNLSKARKDSTDEVRYTGNSGMFDEQIKLCTERVDEYKEKERILKEKFISDFAGYKFYQAYKYKTSFGDSIKLVRYSFNKDISEITESFVVKIDVLHESEVFVNGSVFSGNIITDLERLSYIAPNATFFFLDEGGVYED